MAPLTETEELARPLSAEGIARSTVSGAPLSPDELSRIDAYWRALGRWCDRQRLGIPLRAK
jgi:hypothetical protein